MDTTGTLSGEQIAASAYDLRPLIPQDLSVGIVVATILLAIITAVVVCLRIWVRMGLSGALNRIWNIEDYLLVLAFLLFLPSVVFSILAAYHGIGMRDVHLPSSLYAVRAGEYIVYWEIFYFLSSTTVKTAIGFTCIRIDRRKRVTRPISLNMSVMIITAILALVFVFANCRPLSATWNPALGTCQTVITLETVSYIVSAIQAVTDWICALIPCYIVSKLQMPRRKKISVACILGIGILASVATIIRMPYLKYYDTTRHQEDFLFHVGVIVLCSSVECSLGIVACSLPPLRKLMQIYFENWSSHRSKNQGADIDSSSVKPIPLSSLSTRTRYLPHDHMRSMSGKWDRLNDEELHGCVIMQQTDISITIKDEELHCSAPKA